MILIARESYKSCADEIAALGKEHAEEINVTRNDDYVAYNPEVSGWVQMAKLGVLHIVTVRDDARLVGYGLLFTAPDITNKDITICKCELLFMHKDYRGSLSLKLIKLLEDTAKEVGADYYVCGVKPDADYSKYLLRRGFAKDETYYIKHIKGG